MTDQIQDRRPKIFWAYKTLIDTHGYQLGAYGIATYCVLASMGGETGVCFPAIKTIAEKIGASESVVKDALKKLHQLRYIDITPRKDPSNPKLNLSNLYTLLPPGSPENPPGSPDNDEVVMIKIKKAYNDTFALYPTPMIGEQLLGLAQEYSEVDIVDAFSEAAVYGGKNLAYVRATLRNWKKNGRENKPSGNGNKSAEGTPLIPKVIYR